MSFGGFSQIAFLAAACWILNDPVALKLVKDATTTASHARDPALMAIALPQTRAHFCLRSSQIQ